MPSITYAITACNEAAELDKLLNVLSNHIRKDDEVVLLLDSTTHNAETYNIAQKWNVGAPFMFHRIFKPLNGDFAEFKNFLKKHCSKEFIFFIDADEIPSEDLLLSLNTVLETNVLDVVLVPRINTVENITKEDIDKWGWSIDEDKHINWPDYQFRICRNKPDIKWEGKVHEKLTGYLTLSQFPHDNKKYCLIHPKTIERQRKQNSFYETI